MAEDANPAQARMRFFSGIAARLGIAVLIIVCAALALSLWSVTAGEEREFQERNSREARSIAAVITRDLSERMIAGGGEAVWKHISEAAKQHGAASGASRIAVLNQAGLVKAATDDALVGGKLALDCPGCAADAPAVSTLQAPEGARLRVLHPIPQLPACGVCHTGGQAVRGYVSVEFDLAPLERSKAERRRSIVAIGVSAALVLVALIALLIRALVLRPIDALTDAAQRLGGGELGARAALPGKSELALLGAQFNRMAERLESQVTRIRDAQAEAALLYTLVVEASKNLETSDVATSVAGVVFDKLHPRRVVFFLESIGGAWICACASEGEPRRLETGKGTLAGALVSGAAAVEALLEGVPRELLAEPRGAPRIGPAGDPAGGVAFVLPIVSDERLVGLLAATQVEAHVNEELLANMSAHLALAAANSRNYTGAITDALTGLKNKRYGISRLEEAMFSARRYGYGLAVAMCDIDHFKRVNDTYGHPAGDAVLSEVARRIAVSMRKADLATRYGGEEFLLIFPRATLESLRNIGEKVRESVCASPVPLGGAAGSLAITMSAGMTMFRGEDDTAEAMIARADAALYRAKQAGRNRLEVDV